MDTETQHATTEAPSATKDTWKITEVFFVLPRVLRIVVVPVLMQPSLPFEPSRPNPESRLLNPELLFVRHPRARRYVIRVGNDGTVRVTVPRRGSKREARAFADREAAWIEKQWRRIEDERRRGERSERDRSTTICGAGVTAEDQRVLRRRAKRELPPRLLELAARHRLIVSRVSIRNQRWRWGSCSRNGHICLNWRLVTMPESVRDYVLIHELMHLKRMDHSPRFWRLVAAACPDYQDARRWLLQVPRV